MGQPAKWKKFSKEQLKEIIEKSNSYKEALLKLGYNPPHSKYNKYIKEIVNIYDFDISHYKHTTLKDLKGQKFGRLTVLNINEDIPHGHQQSPYWLCKCDCGNFTSVRGYQLTSGGIQSCGCLRNERIKEKLKLDLTGQRFCRLTVLEEVDPIIELSGRVRSAWKCKCDCGNIIIAKTINLRAGDTKSCGCLRSIGEHRIEIILKSLNLKYQREYKFKDLKTEKGYLMRFDFAVFNNDNTIKCLIEYQGIGHYEEGEWDNSLEDRQKRDQLKRDFCKKNNISLIEIPYWDFEILNENYIKEKINEYCN